MKKTCDWPADDELMIVYHDTEWGMPEHDDRKLFELLLLDTMQAGLSWRTILHKRENFRRVFDNFEPAKIARYSQRKIDSLLKNPGIIRNKLKIKAAVTNAQCVLDIQKEFGSLDAYLWQFVNGKPICNKWKKLSEIPATSPESDAMSKALKKRGLKFIGSTICYAFMQSAGLVNDHLMQCFRYTECG
jgi:DNA-3-methyladenine glycosylase I